MRQNRNSFERHDKSTHPSSDPFPAMAASDVSRENFASNCVGLINDYGFDGGSLGRVCPHAARFALT